MLSTYFVLLLITFVHGLGRHKKATRDRYEESPFTSTGQLENILARLEDAERRIAELQRPADVILETLRRLKGDVRVGHTASLTFNIPGLHVGQVVVFDKVKIDLGSGYNKQTGIYTCPVDGNYFFTASIVAHTGSVQTEIVLEGERIAAMQAQATPSGTTQGSNSAVVHCLRGQTVWVRVVTGNAIFGTTSPLTQFASFLIWDD